MMSFLYFCLFFYLQCVPDRALPLFFSLPFSFNLCLVRWGDLDLDEEGDTDWAINSHFWFFLHCILLCFTSNSLSHDLSLVLFVVVIGWLNVMLIFDLSFSWNAFDVKDFEDFEFVSSMLALVASLFLNMLSWIMCVSISWLFGLHRSFVSLFLCVCFVFVRSCYSLSWMWS